MVNYIRSLTHKLYTTAQHS